MNATGVCAVLVVIRHPPNLHEWQWGLYGILMDIWRPPTEIYRLTFDLNLYQLYNTDNTLAKMDPNQ